MKICERAFGLSHAVLDCSSRTSLEDFSNGVLAPEMSRRRHGGNVDSVCTVFQMNLIYKSYYLTCCQGVSSSQSRTYSRFSVESSYLDDRKVVNVVIAKNFDRAGESVQIQALEVNILVRRLD